MHPGKCGHQVTRAQSQHGGPRSLSELVSDAYLALTGKKNGGREGLSVLRYLESCCRAHCVISTTIHPAHEQESWEDNRLSKFI